MFLLYIPIIQCTIHIVTFTMLCFSCPLPVNMSHQIMSFMRTVLPVLTTSLILLSFRNTEKIFLPCFWAPLQLGRARDSHQKWWWVPSVGTRPFPRVGFFIVYSLAPAMVTEETERSKGFSYMVVSIHQPSSMRGQRPCRLQGTCSLMRNKHVLCWAT